MGRDDSVASDPALVSRELRERDPCPDDLPTVTALGLLGYESADVAHHVLGHGAMCLASGGRIELLSSIQVLCSVRTPIIDLAGPFANLLVGGIAAAAAIASRSTTRLLFALASGFNLLWFGGQLVFSVATRTDDFAWPLTAYYAAGADRYALIAFGVLLYIATRQLVAHLAAGYGPPGRANRIMWTAWFAAGIFACTTALFDSDPWTAVIHYAAPQSWLLSAGLLSVPRGLKDATCPPIARQWHWLLAAGAVVVASVAFLGSGISSS